MVCKKFGPFNFLHQPIAHQRVLFGGHLEPSQTLIRNVKNRRNYLQKVSLARKNRTNLERARGIEMFHASEPVCESLQSSRCEIFRALSACRSQGLRFYELIYVSNRIMDCFTILLLVVILRPIK